MTSTNTKPVNVIALLRPEGEVVAREVKYTGNFYRFMQSLDYTAINRFVRSEEEEIREYDSYEEFLNHYNFIKYEVQLGDIITFDEKKIDDHLSLVEL